MLGDSRMLVRVFWGSWTLPVVLRDELGSLATRSELQETGYQVCAPLEENLEKPRFSRKIWIFMIFGVFFENFPNFPELSCCEFCELSGERRQKMKLSMSSVDFRIVFVFAPGQSKSDLGSISVEKLIFSKINKNENYENTRTGVHLSARNFIS